MDDLRQSLEDNYLTLISIVAGSLVIIAAIVWVTTIFVRKVKKS
jgi:hypothetical protein